MCNSNNQMTFNSKNLTIDLSSAIDDIVNSYINIENVYVECDNCELKDLNTEGNFHTVCCACDMKICNECLTEDFIDEQICNETVDREDWLCFECSNCCENCEEYMYIEDFMSLMTPSGDYEYICRGCVNNGEMDIVRKCEWKSNNRTHIFHKKCEIDRVDNEDDWECCDCSNKNYRVYYDGKNEELGEETIDKYEDGELDVSEILEMKDFEKEDITDELTWFKFYDEDLDASNVVCEECVETNIFHYG